jgi:hypothetical protein
MPLSFHDAFVCRMQLRFLAAFCLGACTLAGCGGGAGLVPVIGQITVDGKPAEGAVLLFHPLSPSVTSVSSAVANADGSFSPVTNSEKGMPVGSYKVSVTWPDPSVKPSERDLMMGTVEPGPDLLRGRYQTKDRSDISVEVAADTKTLPAIELKSR